MTDLSDVALEESLLSAQMSGANIRSLSGEEFTCSDRKVMYLAMRDGCKQEGLKGLVPPRYIEDVWLRRSLSPQGIRDGVAELKRLYEVRTLLVAVSAWQMSLGTKDFKGAVSSLLEAIREAGRELSLTRLQNQKPELRQ